MCAAATRSASHTASEPTAREVAIGPLGVAGTLDPPSPATALVVFAHGIGSSRFSPRNRATR